MQPPRMGKKQNHKEEALNSVHLIHPGASVDTAPDTAITMSSCQTPKCPVSRAICFTAAGYETLPADGSLKEEAQVPRTQRYSYSCTDYGSRTGAGINLHCPRQCSVRGGDQSRRARARGKRGTGIARPQETHWCILCTGPVLRAETLRVRTKHVPVSRSYHEAFWTYSYLFLNYFCKYFVSTKKGQLKENIYVTQCITKINQCCNAK